MADRNSCEAFAFFFKELAHEVDSDKNNVLTAHALEGLALRAWRKSSEFDFADYQLDCDDALIILGVARKTDAGVEYRSKTNLSEWEAAT